MKLRPAALLLCAVLGAAACAGNRQAVDTSDPAVTARVQTALKAHKKELNARFLDVVTHDGIVHITGMVESGEERQHIITLVERLPGVRQLLLNVLVQE